jgi:hypothetical protein
VRGQGWRDDLDREVLGIEIIDWFIKNMPQRDEGATRDTRVMAVE